MPSRLYNELGISIVRNGSWLGSSYEIENADGTESRSYGWKNYSRENLEEMYLRLWIGKHVAILSPKEGFRIRKKQKWAFKLVLGFAFKYSET